MNKTIAIVLCALSLTACSQLPSWMGGADKEIKRLPGERIDALASANNYTVDPAAHAVPFKLPTVASNDTWQQHTGEFAAGSSNLVLSGELSNEQSASVGEGDDFKHSLPPRPVAGAGKVFAMDATGHISAHLLENIRTIVWQSSALENEDSDEVMGGGLALSAGKLYVVSGTGVIAALDAETGAELWKRNVGIPLRSAPRIEDGKLYAISIDSQLFALDSANGATLWTHRGIGETAGLQSSVSPAISGNNVIVPYASGELYALKNADGEEVWRSSLAQTTRTSATSIFNGIAADPVVDEAVVFAASNGGLFSVFNLLNGQSLWNQPIATINPPWVVGDYVFALSDDNVLIAMVKYDGKIRWTKTLSRFKDAKRSLYPIIWRGPLVANDKLVVASSNGEMLLVDAATGDVAKTIDIPDDIETAPIIVGGKVIFITRDAKLYSYQ